jgi:hypothetical protein
MTEPGFDRLRDALNGRADEVHPADLRDRVLRTSRQLGLRRLATAVAGAAAGAVLIAVTAASALPDGTPTVVPGESPTGNPTGAPSQYPGMGITLTPQPGIGTLFFLEDAATTTSTTLRLMSWEPGSAQPKARFSLPRDAAANANVSPDGRWVSWVTGSDGTLHLGDLRDQRSDRVLRSSVDGQLFEPVWSRDSKKLLVSVDGRVGLVEIGNGQFAPLPTNLDGARHAAWAADGSAIGYVTADGAVMIAKPDGSDQKRVANLDALAAGGRRIIGVQSLSVSGKPEWGLWIALYVGPPGSNADAGRSLLSNAMINSGDGHEIGVVGERGRYLPFQASFRPSQGFGNSSHVLRRVDNQRGIELLGGNGEFFAGSDEPAALRGYLLLNT